MSDITIALEHDPPAELTRPIREGLLAFNSAHAGQQRPRHYALLARDKNGEVVGGLIADEHWGWLYIGWLWLPESLRGQGLGSRLLREAEAIGTADGCQYAYLSTFAFQALPFYERHGYKPWGVLVDYPAGSGFTRHYLWKSLAVGSAHGGQPLSVEQID